MCTIETAVVRQSPGVWLENILQAVSSKLPLHRVPDCKEWNGLLDFEHVFEHRSATLRTSSDPCLSLSVALVPFCLPPVSPFLCERCPRNLVQGGQKYASKFSFISQKVRLEPHKTMQKPVAYRNQLLEPIASRCNVRHRLPNLSSNGTNNSSASASKRSLTLVVEGTPAHLCLTR